MKAYAIVNMDGRGMEHYWSGAGWTEDPNQAKRASPRSWPPSPRTAAPSAPR